MVKKKNHSIQSVKNGKKSTAKKKNVHKFLQIFLKETHQHLQKKMHPQTTRYFNINNSMIFTISVLLAVLGYIVANFYLIIIV